MTNYTPSQMNRVLKDIEEKGRDTKYVYPVTILPTDGRTGKPVVSTLEQTPVGEPKHIVYKSPEGAPIKFDFDIELQTYEFMVRGEKHKCTLPKLGSMSAADFFKFAGDMMAFAEAMRTFIVIQTMCNPKVAQSGIDTVGVVLADKILGEPAVSTAVQQVLAENYSRSGSTKTLNEYIKDHESDRVFVELKDKYIHASMNQISKACYGLSKVLSSAEQAPVVTLESANVTPSVLVDAPLKVSELSDAKGAKKQPWKGIL